MDPNSPKTWAWYAEVTSEAAADSSPELAPLLELVHTADSIVRGGIVGRRTSFASGRPQDYVVCLISIRSFRLCIASVLAASHGYSDAAPILVRSLWEMWIRLLDIGDDPIPASIGYLLQSSLDEIQSAKAELEYRQSSSLPIGQLRSNLDVMQTHHSTLESLASHHGYVPRDIARKHGRLSFRTVCEKHGLLKAYKVDYAFGSVYSHGLFGSMSGVLIDEPASRAFVMGPIRDDIFATVADGLRNLARVLWLSAGVLEDESLLARSEELLAQVENAIDDS